MHAICHLARTSIFYLSVSTFILIQNLSRKHGRISCTWHLPPGKLPRKGRAGDIWGAPSLWRDKIVGKFSEYSTWAASCSTHGVYAGSLTDVTRTGQRWLFTTQAPLGVAPSIVELVSLKLALALMSHWNYMYSWLELIVSLKLGLALMLSQISMKQQSCEVKAEPRVARKAFDFKTLQGYFEGLDNRALKRKDFSPKAPPSVADRAFGFKTLQGLFEEQGRASALKRKISTAVKKWPSSEEKLPQFLVSSMLRKWKSLLTKTTTCQLNSHWNLMSPLIFLVSFPDHFSPKGKIGLVNWPIFSRLTSLKY